MSLRSLFGKAPKKTLEGLMRGDTPVKMEDLLALDELECRADIAEAAGKLLKIEKHSRDAYDILGPLAADGNVDAQFIMGDFCEAFMGRPEQAAIWFQRAADQGHPQAQRNYADMLMLGKGVELDQRRAIMYYEKAADAGIPEAQFVMGEALRNGHFSSKDDSKALAWYEKAKGQGYEPAAARIRTFYAASE